MIKTKVAFFEGQLLSSQLEQFEKFSERSDWLEKTPALQKSRFCFDHVNRLFMYLQQQVLCRQFYRLPYPNESEDFRKTLVG